MREMQVARADAQVEEKCSSSISLLCALQASFYWLISGLKLRSAQIVLRALPETVCGEQVRASASLLSQSLSLERAESAGGANLAPSLEPLHWFDAPNGRPTVCAQQSSPAAPFRRLARHCPAAARRQQPAPDENEDSAFSALASCPKLRPKRARPACAAASLRPASRHLQLLTSGRRSPVGQRLLIGEEFAAKLLMKLAGRLAAKLANPPGDCLAQLWAAFSERLQKCTWSAAATWPPCSPARAALASSPAPRARVWPLQSERPAILQLSAANRRPQLQNRACQSPRNRALPGGTTPTRSVRVSALKAHSSPARSPRNFAGGPRALCPPRAHFRCAPVARLADLELALCRFGPIRCVHVALSTWRRRNQFVWPSQRPKSESPKPKLGAAAEHNAPRDCAPLRIAAGRPLSAAIALHALRAPSRHLLAGGRPPASQQRASKQATKQASKPASQKAHRALMMIYRRD